MMYSAYKLNKQGDNIQPWHTPFPIRKQSVVPCPVLTVAFWPAYRFLKRQVRWSGIPISFQNCPQFIVIHTVKGFGIVNKAEIDVFLELSCFFNDPADVDNLNFGSSACSNPAWTSDVHGSHIAEAWLGEFWALLYLHVRWVQLCGSLSILWHCLSLGLEWKLTFFQSCGHWWVFQIRWHIECSTFTGSSFRIWNSSTRIHHLHWLCL